MLKEWREKNGVSQHDLSVTTGISVTGISRYENGAGISLHNALLIERATAGAVPVSAWDSAADDVDAA